MPSSKPPTFPSKNRRVRALAVLALLALLACPRLARAAETLSVAAAADLAICLDDMNAAFKRSHPDADIKVSSGSSGNFATQIKNGGPFEVFLSADIGFPRDLAKAGLADEKSLFTYATGRLVLWTARPEAVDVTKGLEILAKDTPVKKLAIANPEHAPYGRAAKQALEHDQLWDAVQSRLVLGENIAQTATFVATGSADAGIVALSLVIAGPNAKVGKWQEIPADKYAPLEQAAIVTKKGLENPLAKAYLDFLRTPEARTIFDHYGFRLPEKKG